MDEETKRIVLKAYAEGVVDGWNQSGEGDNCEYSMFGRDTIEGEKKMVDELVSEYEKGL